MRRYLVPILMLLTLAVFGCSQSEESKPSPPARETPTEKVAEAAKTAAGEVKEAAAAVADKAGEMEKKAEPAVKEAAGDVKETMAEAKEATAEKAESAAVATTMAADEAAEAAKQAVSPETIVLEASMGNVTFPHGMHSEAFECSTCHGEGTPGLFGLDKDKAHPLCRGCHQEQGAGPTACTGCHQK